MKLHTWNNRHHLYKKKVTFSKPLHTGRKKQSKGSSSAPLKPAIKNKPFQDHSSQDHSLQNQAAIENKPFQDHSLQDHLWQHHFIQNHSFQDHSSIKDVKDIFSPKQAFLPHLMQLATCQASTPLS